MNTIRMYELIKKTGIGDDDAHALVDELLAEINRKFDNKKESLATKTDVARTEGLLRVEISNVKTELTKSIYVASIAQILTILGGLFGILKLMQVT